MAKFFQRLSNAIDAGRAASQTYNTITPAQPANIGRSQRYMMVMILGQSLVEASAIAETLRRTAREKNYRIVLVTDQTDIAIFQIDGCITEYLPPSAHLDGRAQKVDIDAYLDRRISILMDKWEPVQTLPFGALSEAAHQSWKESGHTTSL